jgi:hypothetical protein
MSSAGPIFEIMAQRFHRSLSGSLALLGAGAVLAFPTLAKLPVSSAKASSTVAVAQVINLKVTDLSTAMKWKAAPAGHSSAAVAALAAKTLACLDKVGRVSPDPFGTTGKSGGVVLADISSPTFYNKASPLIQLPSASSEVVIMSKASGALADLATIGRSGALSCLTTQLVGDSSLEGAGKGIKGTASYLAAPHHGAGGGGVRIRFVEHGGLLPGKLYDDEYFYVKGAVEVSMSFINLSSPFNPSWATGAITKVMARAVSEAGKA